MKKHVCEVLGTFFFVLSIGLAVQFGGEWAALAIASALAVLVYAWGHISGGHFNPAVTLGLAVSRRISRSQVLPYWICQLLGAVLGGLLVLRIVGSPLTTVALEAMSIKLMVVELLFTFLLVWVVHNVTAARCNEGKSFYGLAIWLAIFVGMVCVGSMTGGAFNPAVVVGGWFDGMFATSLIWQLLVAQLVGGALAWLAFKALDCDEIM